MTSIEVWALATPIIFTATTALTGYFWYYRILKEDAAAKRNERETASKPSSNAAHTMAE